MLLSNHKTLLKLLHIRVLLFKKNHQKPSQLLSYGPLIKKFRFFSTKIDDGIRTTNQPQNSIWKSSLKSKIFHTTPKEDLKTPSKVDRQQLLKALDADLSYIKEEVSLFELNNPYLYRTYFMLIIGNFIFWVVCADILYNFYSKLGSQEKIQEQRRLYEETKHEIRYLDRIFKYFSFYGYQNITKWAFGLIGIGSSLIFMYLLSRCVSFIRLMPGGKQIKVGLLNWCGSVNSNRVYVHNISDVSTHEHRMDLCHYITMRIRNRSSSLLIDRQGRFTNEIYYDLTVGIKRNFR